MLKINVIEEIRRIFGDKCLKDIAEYIEDVSIKKPQKEDIEKCLLLKKIFSNIVRISILSLLAQAPLPVCALVAILGKHQTLISHNLTALKEMGIIHEQRVKKYKIYSLNKEKIRELFEDICSFLNLSKDI